jgi:hypothetical protein
MFLFLVDDTFDNYKDLWGPGIPSDELIQVVDSFCSICHGEEYDVSLEDRTRFPYFKYLCDFFKKYRKELFPIGIEQAAEFINASVDCLEANAWENRGWTGIDVPVDPRQEKRYYYYRRESTYGWLPCLESTCFYKNISVSKRIRQDPLMKMIRRRWVRASFIINDMFSIQKELRNDEKSNMLLIRGKTMSGSIAFEKTARDLKEAIQDIPALQMHLERKYKRSPEFANLQAYLNLGKAILDGNNQYLLIAERYGQKPFTATIHI